MLHQGVGVQEQSIPAGRVFKSLTHLHLLLLLICCLLLGRISILLFDLLLVLFFLLRLNNAPDIFQRWLDVEIPPECNFVVQLRKGPEGFFWFFVSYETVSFQSSIVVLGEFGF